MARMLKCPPLLLQTIAVFLLLSSLTQQNAGEEGIIEKIKAAGKWLQKEREHVDIYEVVDVENALMELLNKQNWGPRVYGQMREDLENLGNGIPVEKRDQVKLSLFGVNDGVLAEILASAEAYLNEYRKTGVPKRKEEENEEYILLKKLTELLKKLFLNKAQMEFLEKILNGEHRKMDDEDPSASADNTILPFELIDIRDKRTIELLDEKGTIEELIKLRVRVNGKIAELIKQIWFQSSADTVKRLSDQNKLDKVPIREKLHDFVKHLDLAPYFPVASKVVDQLKEDYANFKQQMAYVSERIEHEDQKIKADLEKLMADLKRIFNGQYPTTFRKHLAKFEHFSGSDLYQSDFEWKVNNAVRFARNLVEKLVEAFEKHDEGNTRKYERYHAIVLQNSTNQQMLDLLALEFQHHQNNNNNKLKLYHNYYLLEELQNTLKSPFKWSKPSGISIINFLENKENWSKFDSEENGLLQSIRDCVLRPINEKEFDALYSCKTAYGHWLPERLMFHTERCNANEKENVRFRVALNALRTVALHSRLQIYYYETDQTRLLDAYEDENASKIHEEYEKKHAEAISGMGGYGAKFGEYILEELTKQSEAKMKEAGKAGTKNEVIDRKGKGISHD